MLIVLEGCDGTGKTTLADRFLEAHTGSSAILHKGPIRRMPLAEYEWDLRTYDRTKLDFLLVCDRWHVGEMVYGPLYRGVSQLTPQMQQHVEMYLDSRGAVKLMVDALPATILRRLRDRGEDLLQESHIGLVYDFYREYAEDNEWTIVKSHDEIEPFLEKAHHLQDDVFQLSLLKSYVGPVRPEVLIVSDHHPSLPGGVALPSAFAPVRGSMGSWLMGQLHRHGVQSYGLLNTQVDKDLETAMNILRFPQLITLGAYSTQIAKRAGLDHTSFTHPRDEYTRKTPSTIAYGHRIKEAIK